MGGSPILQHDDTSTVRGAKGSGDGGGGIEVEIEGTAMLNHLIESLPIIGTSIPAKDDRAAIDRGGATEGLC